MSNTRLHKNKGKFNNGLLEDIPQDLENHFGRHNGDRGEFRKAKKDLVDKIAKKEMKEEVRIIETFENIDFDIPEQDKILEQIFGR